MEPKHRKRSSNYSLREKELLLMLVEKYGQIIENKKTNAVFNKEKLNCWETIATEYNANQTTGLRTSTQLKSTYEQMKKIAKQHQADEKVEIVKTGGGTFTSKITTMDEKILTLIKENYFSIDNKYDSNNYSDPQIGSNKESETEIDEVWNSEKNENVEKIVVICDESDVPPTLVKTNKSILKDQTNVEPLRVREAVIQKSRKRTGENTNTSEISKKKLQLITRKIEVLETIHQTELENLKGRRLDNDIKEIIKERELIELEIKKQQYENVCDTQVLDV